MRLGPDSIVSSAYRNQSPQRPHLPHHIKTHKPTGNKRLTVGLLVSGSCTWTAELLGFAPSVVRNKEGSVVLYEGLLELVLGVLVDVFLVVGDLHGDMLLVKVNPERCLQADPSLNRWSSMIERTIDFAIACLMA